MNNSPICVPLYSEGVSLSGPDLVYAYIVDGMTFLYREGSGDNRYPDQAITEFMDRSEASALVPRGTVQVMADGVPEVILTAEAAENAAIVCHALYTREVVPSGTPVFTMPEGRRVDMGTLVEVAHSGLRFAP